MKLTTDQITILNNCRIEENRIYLTWQLDRKAYMDINQVLETIWAKWTKWKKAHIAEWMTQEQIEEAFEDIIETGEVETLKETIKKYQFFPTPTEISKRMVELAEIKQSDMVCEPSAWLWNIAELIPECLTLTLVELDKEKIPTLQDKFNKINHLILNMDFLELWKENTADKFVMNPPYSKRQDYKHIKKAIELLNDWWRIVWLMSRWILFREDYKDLKEEIMEHWYIEELEAGAFKESGTMVWTCLIVYNK